MARNKCLAPGMQRAHQPAFAPAKVKLGRTQPGSHGAAPSVRLAGRVEDQEGGLAGRAEQ